MGLCLGECFKWLHFLTEKKRWNGNAGEKTMAHWFYFNTKKKRSKEKMLEVQWHTYEIRSDWRMWERNEKNGKHKQNYQTHSANECWNGKQRNDVGFHRMKRKRGQRIRIDGWKFFTLFSLARNSTLTRSFWCPLRAVSACVFVSNLAFTVFISILWSMRYAFVVSHSHAHAICPCSSLPCFGECCSRKFTTQIILYCWFEMLRNAEWEWCKQEHAVERERDTNSTSLMLFTKSIARKEGTGLWMIEWCGVFSIPRCKFRVWCKIWLCELLWTIYVGKQSEQIDCVILCIQNILSVLAFVVGWGEVRLVYDNDVDDEHVIFHSSHTGLCWLWQAFVCLARSKCSRSFSMSDIVNFWGLHALRSWYLIIFWLKLYTVW